MNQKLPKKWRKTTLRGRVGERGQSFMELAVSLVFLLMLLVVVIDLGWAFYTMTALRDTAQEAASYGIMCPDEAKIEERLLRSATQPVTMTDIAEGNYFVTSQAVGANPAWKKGSVVKVEVTINHRIMVPFLGSILGRTTYPLTVDVTDTIMVDNCPAS